MLIKHWLHYHYYFFSCKVWKDWQHYLIQSNPGLCSSRFVQNLTICIRIFEILKAVQSRYDRMDYLTVGAKPHCMHQNIWISLCCTRRGSTVLVIYRCNLLTILYLSCTDLLRFNLILHFMKTVHGCDNIVGYYKDRPIFDDCLYFVLYVIGKSAFHGPARLRSSLPNVSLVISSCAHVFTA